MYHNSFQNSGHRDRPGGSRIVGSIVIEFIQPGTDDLLQQAVVMDFSRTGAGKQAHHRHLVGQGKVHAQGITGNQQTAGTDRLHIIP